MIPVLVVAVHVLEQTAEGDGELPLPLPHDPPSIWQPLGILPPPAAQDVRWQLLSKGQLQGDRPFVPGHVHAETSGISRSSGWRPRGMPRINTTSRKLGSFSGMPGDN